MKTGKASKPVASPGGPAGPGSPKPAKSWSKVAANNASKQPSQERNPDANVSGKTSVDKMLVVLSGLPDTEADVTTKNGLKYRGVIKSVATTGPVALVLKNAKLISSSITSNSSNLPSELEIKAEDLLEVFSPRVTLDASDAASNGTHTVAKSNAWKTDTDISGKGQLKERVLQAWQPPADDEGFSIEDDRGTTKETTSGKKWDQFAANETLFGVKSEWDENVYTHKLDTSRPDFAQRQAQAKKLAREIEQSSSTNAHVLEERGVAVDDSGMTEEDKYSGVHRTASAWQPPARRLAQNLPTSRSDAPVDPAIISSQLARPGSSGHRTAQSVASASRAGPIDGASKNGTATPPKFQKPIEADIMARFKQFASNERDRLSVKKAATFKKEKDGRLQDLLAFSKDFKLTTPVPEDLIPILAKDRAKQDALLQKGASSAASSPSLPKSASPDTNASERKLPETLRARIDKARQSPVPDLSASPLPKPKSPEVKKLKPLAAEFKPFNPAATSFTPSTGPRAPQVASPALSTASSQPRQIMFSIEAAAFFPKKPQPPSQRTPILDQFNPFKTYRTKNPDSPLDIETPLKVDPSWPGDENSSISHPPLDGRQPPVLTDQYRSSPSQYGQTPPMMYLGSPQHAQGIMQQAYYLGKGQQFMPVPQGQYTQYQTGPGLVPPQYMYSNAQGYNARALQPHMMPVPYNNPQFNGYNPQIQAAIGNMPFPNHTPGSPRPRQMAPPGQLRSPELQRPTPRPPPMSADPSTES